MHRALRLYGFPDDGITMLVDREATRPAIEAALETLAERMSAGGVAVVAISTHTRLRSGRAELVTADGDLLSSKRLASLVGAIPSRTWVVLPTCYAGAYARPGVVGSGRIATFAAPADRRAYQLGSAGSYLMLHMVKEAMIDAHAPDSVESAFRHAVGTLRRVAPSHVPIMSDRIPGELELGPVTWSADGPDPYAPHPWRGGEVEPPPAADTPTPSPAPHDRIRICAEPLRLNCSRDQRSQRSASPLPFPGTPRTPWRSEAALRIDFANP
jgi:hypothetical protein